MNRHLIYMLALCSMLVTGCKDDTKDPTVWDTTPCDPSRPVEFKDFTPKEGGVRTRLYISGSNFGKDESKISVTIGGQKTPVISSNVFLHIENSSSVDCGVLYNVFTS